MNKLIILALSSLLLLVGLPSAAFSADDVACAAIYPCDESGNLLEEYRGESPCLGHYKSICAGRVVNLIGSDLVSCNEATSVLQKKNQALVKQNKKLLRKIKVLRRAAK